MPLIELNLESKEGSRINTDNELDWSKFANIKVELKKAQMK